MAFPSILMQSASDSKTSVDEVMKGFLLMNSPTLDWMITQYLQSTSAFASFFSCCDGSP